jgi:hypothetical protein
MRIAILFDEESPARVHNAGYTARQAILGCGVLQASDRNMVVRVGTVLVNHGDPARRTERVEEVFFGDSWRLGDPIRLRETSQRAAIFAWVVSNVDRATAVRLHASLASEPTYIGLLAVDLAVSAHLQLYRRSLQLLLRIEGPSCSLFWRAFDSESRDVEVLEHLKSLGFATVQWEDIGARETVLDEFDTIDHFRRLEYLRQLLSTTLARGTDDADDLLVVLEDLSPRLAATLGTAAGSYLRATSEEDLAQVGLSARRYCDQLADALYRPRSEPVNGRDVSRDKVKNRLWAYVEQQLGGPGIADRSRLGELGDRIDRIVAVANGELHGAATRQRVGQLLTDLALLSAALLALAPRENRKPYLAYSPRISDMFREWFPSVG